MAYLKDNKYWKITDAFINRKMNVAKLRVAGFKNKTSSDNSDVMIDYKDVILSGEYFPFSGNTDQIANAYIKIKLQEPYFKDAEDV